jgi:hypothetical protein
VAFFLVMRRVSALRPLVFASRALLVRASPVC